jgi:hypothetical protein
MRVFCAKFGPSGRLRGTTIGNLAVVRCKTCFFLYDLAVDKNWAQLTKTMMSGLLLKCPLHTASVETYVPTIHLCQQPLVSTTCHHHLPLPLVSNMVKYGHSKQMKKQKTELGELEQQMEYGWYNG